MWFKVDDQLPMNEKMLTVSLAAVGLWVEAGAWASASQTEGRLPKRLLRVLHPDASQKEADELVKVGLWEDRGDYWQIHDFLEYNPPKDQVDSIKAQRSAAGRTGGLKSGKVRRSKTEAKREAKVEAKREANAKQNRTPSPSPSHISTDVDISPKPPTGVESDERQIREPSSEPTLQFDQLMAIYPNHDNPDDGLRELKRVLHRKSPHTSFAALLAGAQILANEHRDPRYVPTLGNWLRKGGWKNKPRPRAPASSGPVPSRSQLNQDANAALIARYAQEEARQPQEARKEIGS